MYYSQHGEDFILQEVFKDQVSGFFVDVGALDGIHFSNTYLFELKGWKGICVEAHPGYIEMLKKNRPMSACFSTAAGPENKNVVEFYTTERGSLSTLDPSLRSYFGKRFKKYFKGYSRVSISMSTLDTLLLDISPSKIDFVSVDVEGCEIGVLRGFSIARHKPEVVILECVPHLNKVGELDEYMIQENRYIKSLLLGGNIFYSLKEETSLKIQKAAGRIPDYKETVHPLFG